MSMKLLSTCALLVLLASVAQSQVDTPWKWAHPTPQGNSLRWCKIWDANTWYAAGDGGTFMKTADAGESWHIVIKTGEPNSSGQYGNISDAHFFSKQRGILTAGQNGLVETTDGGTTFHQIPGTSTGDGWIRLSFLNESLGYVCAFLPPTNRLGKTTNGGTNWSFLSTLPVGQYSDVAAVPDSVVLAATAGGNVLRSTDGGLTWGTPVFTGVTSLARMVFLSRDTGFVAGGQGAAARTTNGGLQWAIMNTGITTTIYDIDIHQADGTTVFMSGAYANLCKSTDYGLTWDSLSFRPPDRPFPGTSDAIFGSDFLADDSLLAVGSSGYVFTKFGTNRTLHWKGVKVGLRVFLDVWAENPNGKVIAVGKSTIPGQIADQVLFSVNGGIDWSVASFPDNTALLTRLSMINSQLGYAGGDNGVLFSTTDGGLSWFSVPSPTTEHIFRVRFLDAQRGWLLCSSSKVFKTLNGGASWEDVSDPSIAALSIDMLDDNLTGWLVGVNGLVRKTTNGGATWISQNSQSGGYLYDIKMYDRNVGFLCGFQTVHKTSNGGATWNMVTTPFPTLQFMTIGCVDSLNWFLTGFAPCIRTTNGGQSWMIDPLPNPITSYEEGRDGRIFMLSVQHGFMPSVRAGILRYDNPGGTGVVEWEPTAPSEYKLFQNYPNPFNPSTTIKFTIPKSGKVSLRIHDITGREIRTVLDDIELAAGTVAYHVDGSTLASGVYFYSLIVDGELKAAKRMLLMK